jgi:pimeloyl-ACP methyl ester carboxylesterase
MSGAAVAGTGPLVILIHGFPEGWYSWRHQIQALADDAGHWLQQQRPAEVNAALLAFLRGWPT